MNCKAEVEKMRNKMVPVAFRRLIGFFSVALLTGALLFAQQTDPAPPPAQLLSPEQLDTMVAPIALYPDPLLSQVLVAATYPLEISEANQWLAQNRGLQGQQLAEAAQQQQWDPSIQALVAFPDVIGRLNADIRWTTDLGNAFLAQQPDVMAAVQRMRARAMAAGKLNSNAQEVVTTQMDGGQQAIDIQPANPEMMYVPYYNPAYIWGPPAWGYYPAWDWGFGFGFGPGIYIGGFFGGIGWSTWGWGCNWFHGFVYQNPYFFAHAGFHGWHGGTAWGHYTVWAHDPSHRLGVAYSNQTLANRYGAASLASRGYVNGHAPQQVYRPQQSFAGRVNTPQTGGWSHFNGNNAARVAPNNSYRGTTPSYGRSFSSSPSVNRSYTAPSSHYSAPSYSRSYTAPSPHYSAPSAPSYNRSYSAPSYHYSAPSAPSYNRSYSAPGYHSSSPSTSHSYSAPRSSGGGGGFHSSGGGGGSHSSGGSGGGHNGHH
jgi:hypothetical protein